MKNLRFFEKIVFFFNSIAAFLLLLSYILPLLPPKTFASFSVLSLGVPILIVINALFLLYWLVKIKKQLLLSLVVLVVGYLSFGSLYKFSESNSNIPEEAISVMNYNVRLFNLYQWIPEKGIESKIEEFIKKEAPDVLLMQEYHPHKNVDLSFFKYKFEKLSGNKTKYGQAIFSQYPIINSGSVEFPNTSNNAIYADVVKGKDTLRFYNIHLQSLRIDPNLEKLTEDDAQRIFKGVGNTFKRQQFQAELFRLHKNKSPYKTVVGSDLNNTAFSYAYKEIKDNLVDNFKAAGNGFGRTYHFKFFPIRIDFILTDPEFTVNSFKTYDVLYSDHYPIMSKISLSNKED